MSEYLDRAARVSTDFAPADQCAHHGGCDCVHQHAALRIGKRFLRAYQAPREWTIPELEALHPEAILVNSSGNPKQAYRWLDLIQRGSSVGPLRLVYNPDDLKEN